MFKNAILLFLCLREIYSNTTEIEFEIANRIVGGERCEIEEYPYLVAIMHSADAFFICGGSLVSATWVLTARHCMEKCEEKHFYMVVAGVIVHDSNWRKHGQVSLVKRCYPHRNTDLGLMHLETPMKETKTVGFVKLATYVDIADRNFEEICSNGTVMGWGVQHVVDLQKQPDNPSGREYDPYLQCLQLAVISRDTCEERIKTLISKPLPKTLFCAFKLHHDACMGDSGGPFMCEGLQYGIVSSGFGCAFRDYPGLYIKNFQYENFIKSVIFKANVTTQQGNQMCSVAKNPFMVAIAHRRHNHTYDHLCSGSMLTKVWVLTAGHCTTHCAKPNYYTVFIGVSSLLRTDSHDLDTLSSKVHSCYQDPDRNSNQDIALMKLKKSFDSTERLSFVKFATSSYVQNRKFKDHCNSAMIIGYGPQNNVQNLDCMQVSTTSQKLCKSTWNSSYIGDQHACVVTTSSGSCYEELGRPLICNGVQFGVLVSIDCNDDKIFFPILIAKVYKYEQFLKEMINVTENTEVEKSRANLNNSVNLNFFIFFTAMFFGNSFIM